MIFKYFKYTEPEMIQVAFDPYSHLKRFVKFGIFSAVSLTIQVGLFWVLHGQINLIPLVAGGIASFISLFINYLFNRNFTWGDRARHDRWGIAAQMGKYYIVIAIGYVVYFLTFLLLLQARVPPSYGNFIAAILSGGSNFFLHSSWTFRAGLKSK